MFRPSDPDHMLHKTHIYNCMYFSNSPNLSHVARRCRLLPHKCTMDQTPPLSPPSSQFWKTLKIKMTIHFNITSKCFQLTGLVLIVKCVKFFCLSTWWYCLADIWMKYLLRDVMLKSPREQKHITNDKYFAVQSFGEWRPSPLPVKDSLTFLTSFFTHNANLQITASILSLCVFENNLKRCSIIL